MALERLSVTRGPAVYFNQSVTNGQNLSQALTSGASSTPLVTRCAGMAWILGYGIGTQAPAAGFPTISFYASPGSTTAAFVFQLAADPSNANGYFISVPVLSPWYSIDWTQGGSSGNVFIQAYTLPEAPGGISSSIGPSTPIYVKDQPLTPLGYAQYPLAATAESMATMAGGTIPAGALYCLIQLGVGGTGVTCRWRDDGTSPTTTTGFPLLQGVQFLYEGTPLSAFQMIGTAAGPTEVNLSFYK